MRFIRPNLLVAAATFILLSAPALLRADDYKVDPVHSSTVFMAHHFGAGFVLGLIPGSSGKIVVDADVTKSSFDISVDVDKLSTASEQRDTHLKGPDFFDVKQFPAATFKSTAIKAGDDDKHWAVTGDLTIHGVTKSVTISMENTGSGQGMGKETRQGFLAQFTIKRSEFGMNFMAGAVGDDIRLIVALEAIKQ